MQPKKVLVLDANEAPYALYVARSLGSAGYIIDLASTYGRISPYCNSKYVNNHLFYPDPTWDVDAFSKFLYDNAARYDIILPLMEKTQLATSMLKEELEEQGILIPIPSYDIFKKAMDKTYVLKTAKKIGIRTPNGLILNPDEIKRRKITDLVGRLKTPIIVKTSTEVNVPPGKRYFVVKNHNEMIKACKILSSLGPVIIQEYIKGIGLGVSTIISQQHQPVAISGHLRILESLPQGGPSVIAKTYLHQEAINCSLRLLKHIKWQGVAMVEYKLTNDNVPFFMELNPRFWGTTPLAIASGVDFPKLLVEKYNDIISSPAKPTKTRKLIHMQGLALLFVKEKANIFKNIFQPLLKGALSKGIVSITEFQYFDLKPFLTIFLREIKRTLNKNKMGRINNILFGPKLPIKKIIKAGVKNIIDLREEGSDEEKNEAKKYWVGYHKIPVKDDAAPTISEFTKGLELLDCLSKEAPTYIHCREGMGRAPMFAAGYLIFKGSSFEDALSYVYSIKPASNINSTQKSALWTLFKRQTANKEKL